MMTQVELAAKYGEGYAPRTARERDRYWRDAFGVSLGEMMGEDYGQDMRDCANYFEPLNDEEDEL